ncbi:class I SAM-dependent methyltransferase [Nonomuraea sp. NPDC050556]|uniref:class I SAM-dependent methyltransferase n=1 Tax=Nonomuraea sp. NPDC050556 TaxID=3364369 RepID=UPI0037A372BB
MDVEELATRWRERLESWAIPARILAEAPVDPWAHSPVRFASRTDRALTEPDGGPTVTRVLEALPEKGSLLDLGSGTGASSLPLHARVGEVVAVDESAGMLSGLEDRAGKVGVPVTLVEGRWPDVAADVPVCDVAVSGHVVYNVPDLVEFVRAAHAHVRRRVVLELTHRHPMSWLNPLWEHFHDVRRPVRPVAEDVVALVAALGYRVRVEEREAPLERFVSLEELSLSACRRLCLDPMRAGEVGRTAMELGMWPVPRDRWATIWWDKE